MTITLEVLRGAVSNYACIRTEDFSIDVELPRHKCLGVGLRERANEYQQMANHYAELAEKCDDAAALIPVGALTPGRTFGNQTMSVKIMCGAVYAYAFITEGMFSLDVQLPSGKSASDGLAQRAAEFRVTAQENAELAEKCHKAADIAVLSRRATSQDSALAVDG